VGKRARLKAELLHLLGEFDGSEALLRNHPRAAGRPAILIPLPSATDDHQTANAREMAKAGGARMISQKNFTPVELAKQMQKLGLEPGALANAASRARAVGRPNAAADLADLVERTGRDLGTDPLVAEEMILTPIPNGAFA
ncbi:MAG TPA: glycosyltransferase, partial [Allosphingosinicella sp.]